ncbi:MAG: hypothetical protein M1834_001061 [Cirrosporium novae-zelandiae]|nr:MAG: hypothetical protein M1834_001061 [Cirrosporium novae-zelandiae]
MALCARYIPELVSNHGGQMKASEFYAKYVRAHIMERVTSYADIDTVQTLVLLSLHDWGMATRMSQTIEAGLKDMESRTSEEPRTPHSTPIIRESIRRTIWACFVMDCMLGCGKHRPQSFRSSELDFPLPISNEDFEFESQAAAIAPSYLVRFDHGDRDNTPMPPRNLTMGSEQSLAIIIQGVDIWSSLSSWICSGGRKIKSSGPSYPPWNENSCWYQVNKALQFWRVRLSPRLIYSPKNNNLVVHVSRNHGEVFVIINLLYYINLVFLHREYIPFFPHRVYHPCGPIDAPLLSEEAPPGWWNESAKTLFEAAANIVDLLQGLHQNDILFQTPFTSFCLYVAAGTLAYGHTWPHMAPGLLHAQEKYNWGFQWLQQASSLWPISKGWHETLAKLSILYERIQKDAVRYSGVGRDRFADLEDSLNRMAEVEGGGATGGGGSAPAANILLTLAQSSSPIIENENGPVVGSEQTRQNQQHDHQLNPPNHLSMPPSHHYDHSQPNNNNNNNQEEQNDNEPSLPHHSIPHSSPPPPPFSPSIKDFMGSQDLLTSMMGEPLGDWFPNFSIF